MLPKDSDSVLKLEQLRSAFKRKLNLEFIETILQGKGDINFRISDGKKCAGSTALHFAQNRDVMELLINCGADFTLKNNKEQTVLHLERFVDYNDDWGSVKKLSNEVVDLILSAHVEKSVSTNPTNENGLTHFHIACMADHAAAVQMFLDSGVPADLAVGEDSTIFPGCTGLHIAVKSCALEVVKVLVNCGADICAKDRYGMTVMHWLIQNSMKILDSLVVEEVKVDRANWLSKLKMNQEMIYFLLSSNEVDNSLSMDEIGLSKFHIACSIEDASVVKQFWSQETQINHKVNADSDLWPGYKALHFAAHFDINTVHMLIKKDADIMAECTNGITPFDVCLERYSIDNIHLIMSLQPIWQSITLLGGKIKLLDLVSAMKDIEQFRLFLDKHVVDVAEDSPLWPGFTPLHLAVMLSEQSKNASNYTEDGKFEPDLGLIEECLSRGANVDAEDALGCTPLHLAFRHQRTRTIEKILQSHDSSANPIDKDNVSHLHIACASGNEGVVEKLLKSGANPNLRTLSPFKFYRRGARTAWLVVERIHAGSTPLHIAVAGENAKVARLLLESGGDVNITDDNGATPIHCMLARKEVHRDQEMIDALLSADLVPVSLGDARIGYLHVASFFDHVDAAERLLDLGVDVDARLGRQSALNDFRDRYGGDYISEKFADYRGSTALQITAWQSSWRVMKLLLKRGAEVLVKSPCGESPLDSMLEDGYITVLAEFLQTNEAFAKRVEEGYGLTPLHLACCENDADMVKQLIDSGANVNAQFTEEACHCWVGFTLLHFYIDNCDNWKSDAEIDLKMIEILLDAGADVSVCDAKKQTPLHSAFHYLRSSKKKTSRKVLNAMLNSIKNFDVNPTDDVGWSHFLIACFAHNTTAMKKFLKHGVDVNAKINSHLGMKRGTTPLHLVTKKPFWGTELEAEAIEALLEHGADVDAQDTNGNTVLHQIARFAPNRTDIFRKLFGAGADLKKLNAVCESPFTMLVCSEIVLPAVIQLFLERDGCYVNEFNVADERGLLARRLCVTRSIRNDRTGIFEILLQSRDIAKPDATGRTAMHNIVSSSDYSIAISVEEYSGLIARLSNMGIDIDSQDHSGKSALHCAAQFKNRKAIAALLLNGADVNLVDTFGKTAFVYGADFCKCSYRTETHQHSDAIDTFLIHLKKMNHFHLDINHTNRDVMINVQPGFDEVRMESFYEILNAISLIKFEKNSLVLKLTDILSETGLIAIYPLKAAVRELIDEVFEDSNILLNRRIHTEIIGLLEMQVKKARKRITLIDPSADSLNQAVGFSFPETCSRIILKCLSNDNLENLISSFPSHENP